ncbi:hypothetical protein [Mucilaginibacter ginkgonis]|uniref:Uncharacterized protein n=1 Tax=Mucilaginibacter ginkgonis TaxID=2682091 RepID=A0A6I4I102_9SPHI|nr:hypothetical protein [Mucilaginibacter ginkgonis]QQL51243.1 hypothetical protein GO620_007285 [Mucilaginibacter ginkgonis]
MNPFPVVIAQELHLLILPDSIGHADGHPVLTYSYSIFEKTDDLYGDNIFDKESRLHLKDNDDPNYRGVILFEQPGKLFTYEPALHKSLDSDEVEELIEHITEYRDHAAMWLL